MAPFKALHGRKCQSPIGQFETDEIKLLGSNSIHDVNKKVKIIKEKLMTAQSRQKSYANKRRQELQFQMGDQVFLKISPMKEVMRFRKKGKLSPRYIGPFPIVKRVQTVAYKLDLPPELQDIHPIFHISMLKKYVLNTSHILPDIPVVLDNHLNYEEQPVATVDK